MVMRTAKTTIQCKVRTQVVKNRTILLTRRLTSAGKMLVKLHDQVSPEKIVLEGEELSGFRSVELARVLEVSKKKAVNYLQKEIGQKVMEGEPLAEKRGLLGLSSKKILSPIDGVVKNYDENSGILTIEYLPQRERITAGVWGEVVKIDKDRVEIKTKVTEIFGAVGSGRERGGVIKIAAKHNEFLLSSMIDESCHDRILAGGALIAADAFGKSMVLGATGIIAGGINARDFWGAGGGRFGSLNFSSDIGITIVATEGFGHLNLSANIYKTLVENNGRFALINGDQAKITVPHQETPDKEVEEEKVDGFKELELGDSVRIIGAVNFGQVGKVAEIGQGKERLDSGLTGRWVKVDLGEKKVKVPVENLEILISR